MYRRSEHGFYMFTCIFERAKRRLTESHGPLLERQRKTNKCTWYRQIVVNREKKQPMPTIVMMTTMMITMMMAAAAMAMTATFIAFLSLFVFFREYSCVYIFIATVVLCADELEKVQCLFLLDFHSGDTLHAWSTVHLHCRQKTEKSRKKKLVYARQTLFTRHGIIIVRRTNKT